jgi:hypothetical protein
MLPVAFEPSQRCCSTPCGEETQQPQGQGFQPSLARRAASQSLPEGREDAVSAAAYWFERTDPRLLLEAAGHGAYENGALFRPLGDVGLMIDARWWRPSRAAHGRRSRTRAARNRPGERINAIRREGFVEQAASIVTRPEDSPTSKVNY